MATASTSNLDQTKEKETLSLIEDLLDGGCSPAWSCTNLLAVPTPPSRLPLSVTITHFAGNSLPKGKSTSRLSFILTLPPPTIVSAHSHVDAHISQLDFSPCGGHLLVVTNEKGKDDRLIVFEQLEGTIDEWKPIWNETLARFGEDVEGGKAVISLRWLGEPRKWYTRPSTSTSKRPLICTPFRSPLLTGSSFILILSCGSMLFVHLPRAVPLIPSTILIPLSMPITLTALPTLPTISNSSGLFNSLSPPSPQNDIDDLVANLVDGGAPSPAVTSLGLSLGGAPRVGVNAMRDQLKAAERKGLFDLERRRVDRAAIGMIRGKNALEGETTFLIAMTASTVESFAEPVEEVPVGVSALESLGLEIPIDLETMDESEGFGITSLSELEDSFGSSKKMLKQRSSVSIEPDGSGSLDGEGKVELCELIIRTSVVDGPRLTVRPLSAIFLVDPSDPNPAGDLLTHLEWLEDLTSTVSDDLESVADLRLLAVQTCLPADEPASTLLTSWALSNQPHELSPAFNNLETKKSDVTLGEKEWHVRRVTSRILPNKIVTGITPRLGPAITTFLIAEADITPDQPKSTSITVLDSLSLEPRFEFGTTIVSEPGWFTSIQVSPNKSLACLVNSSDFTSKPALIAVSFGAEQDLIQNLSDHLALAIIRQVDTSDLGGRIIGLGEEVVLSVLQIVRDLLQGMLSSNRELSSTPLQLELLGVSASLFRPFSGLALRSSVAFDILQFSALVRAFSIAENRERGSAPETFRCDGDSVWSLIAYASWYCDFCKSLVDEIVADSDPTTLPGEPRIDSPRRLLLILPISRNLLLSSVRYILRLQSFLLSFVDTSNVAVQVARDILNDTVGFSGLVLTEWIKILSEIDGIELNIDDLKESLLTFTISSSFGTINTTISNLLSLPALRKTSLPTPPATPITNYESLDIVRKGRIDLNNPLQACTKCGEMTEKQSRREVRKWSKSEIGFGDRCLCGGLWISIGSKN